LKRPLSPGPDEPSDNNKRSRVELSKRRVSSPSGGKRTPIPSTWPSPDAYSLSPAAGFAFTRDEGSFPDESSSAPSGPTSPSQANGYRSRADS
jgi:hypothetical protein